MFVVMLNRYGHDRDMPCHAAAEQTSRWHIRIVTRKRRQDWMVDAHMHPSATSPTPRHLARLVPKPKLNCLPACMQAQARTQTVRRQGKMKRNICRKWSDLSTVCWRAERHGRWLTEGPAQAGQLASQPCARRFTDSVTWLAYGWSMLAFLACHQ